MHPALAIAEIVELIYLWDGEGGLSDDGPSFHLLRPVTQTDMECLLVHSSRVKAFHFTAEAVTAGICRLLEEIRPFLPQGFLFPNLRSLSFSGQTSKRTELLGTHLRLFLPDSVTRIWMNLNEVGNWSLLPLLPPLHTSFPSVTLITSTGGTQVDERSIIPTFLRSPHRVMHLQVPTLDQPALEHLASLSTLKSLILQRSLNPSIIWPAGFPALMSLSFDGAPFDIIANLIPRVSKSPIAHLDLGTTDLPTESGMRSLCLLLSTHIADSTLSRLHTHDNFSLDAHHGFGGHRISPLFYFGSMHDLRLWVPGGFKLDDATVWDLAGSFPKLRCLYLASSSTEHCAPGMTLAGLREFATHCPQLKRMRISFDAAVIPPAGDDIFLAEFTWLDVPNSPIGSPPHVARFLSGIFPLWGGKAL
ncbi:hypothetical protein C8J57DRAFT_1585700 [Mycena rebaudengoi]|nr:hypothetical protein C8J57DRAFT_1585700 [Mycena rebaudengoi]